MGLKTRIHHLPQEWLSNCFESVSGDNHVEGETTLMIVARNWCATVQMLSKAAPGEFQSPLSER